MLPHVGRRQPRVAGDHDERPQALAEALVLDADDREITRPGHPGRIFVTSEMVFEGYTNGSRKPMIDGLTSSGDIGHLDAEGRLFVDGREDEMIVSGGENVFPRDVVFLDELPRTATGKVLKRELAEL